MARQIIDGEPSWYFRAVFGTRFIDEFNSGTALEELIYNNGVNIFSTKERLDSKGRTLKYLISGGDSEWRRSSFGECENITNAEAYRIFGIVNMEDAVEKTYCLIDYTQQKRDDNINDILS